MIAASVPDFRELARRRLPHFLFEYIDGGSYAEVTLGRNVADLGAIALRQRVLRDVSALDLSTRLFGQDLALPLALAPIGLAGLNARALPAIAEAVGDQLTVLADGGIRSGLDVVRMLALGAKGVLLGRAWAYALAAAGEAGVTRMLAIIEAEMRVAMALTGVTRISDIDQSILAGVQS